jgi:hypothetical protein
VELDKVRDEYPQHEPWEWIEAELERTNNIPREPQDAPCENNEKESHSADSARDKESELLELCEIFPMANIYIVNGFMSFSQLGYALHTVFELHMYEYSKPYTTTHDACDVIYENSNHKAPMSNKTLSQRLIRLWRKSSKFQKGAMSNFCSGNV